MSTKSLTIQSSTTMEQQMKPRHHLAHTVSDASSSEDTIDSCHQQQPPPKRHRRGPKRSVTFAPTSNLIIFPAKSTQDLQSSWYTEHDRNQFRYETSHCCRVMREKSSCGDHMEGIAYALLASERGMPTDDIRHSMMKRQDMIHPCERILTRGIEAIVSPTVGRLMEHKRKAVVRRVLDEQERLRHQRMQMKRLGMSQMIGDAEFEWRMSMALAQCSMESTVFAKEWAILKLLDD